MNAIDFRKFQFSKQVKQKVPNELMNVLLVMANPTERSHFKFFTTKNQMHLMLTLLVELLPIYTVNI